MVDVKMKKNLLNELKNFGIEFLENQDMSFYSSIKAGGRADLIMFPKNEAELVSIVNLTKTCLCGCRCYVIGGGTNTFFKEERIFAPVISFKKFDASILKISDISKKIEAGSETVLRAGAGVSTSKILNYAIKHNFGGCEFFYGIPGTVGGAVRMNAGSKESVIENIVEAIDIITYDGIKSKIAKKDLKFSYRSIEIDGIEGNYFITAAYLKLYKTSESKVTENIQIFKKRKSGQPLGEFSLGCIFKNPDGISAGKLIEEIGFKGFSAGGARVSEKHANFIINEGGAKPSDIMFLIKNIEEKALISRGIKLNTEIKII